MKISFENMRTSEIPIVCNTSGCDGLAMYHFRVEQDNMPGTGTLKNMFFFCPFHLREALEQFITTRLGDRV